MACSRYRRTHIHCLCRIAIVRCGCWDQSKEGEPPLLRPPFLLYLLITQQGKYCNDSALEFPREFFTPALAAGKLSPRAPDSSINRMGVKSRKPLSEWRANGWLPAEDPRGWFQWYMRYYLGRRTDDDAKQIARWRSFGPRHSGGVLASSNYRKGDLGHRPVQRQVGRGFYERPALSVYGRKAPPPPLTPAPPCELMPGAAAVELPLRHLSCGCAGPRLGPPSYCCLRPRYSAFSFIYFQSDWSRPCPAL